MKFGNVKNCKGCQAFIRMEPKDNHPIKRECAFTYNNYVTLPKCPCKECMVKIVCRHRCENLDKVIKKFNHRKFLFHHFVENFKNQISIYNKLFFLIFNKERKKS